MQAIEITKELADVAEEFAMSKYANQAHRAAALLEHVVKLRADIAKYEAMLHKQFEATDTLPRLYEAWGRLPACPLMAVIGDAIQDIQAHDEQAPND